MTEVTWTTESEGDPAAASLRVLRGVLWVWAALNLLLGLVTWHHGAPVFVWAYGSVQLGFAAWMLFTRRRGAPERYVVSTQNLKIHRRDGAQELFSLENLDSIVVHEAKTGHGDASTRGTLTLIGTHGERIRLWNLPDAQSAAVVLRDAAQA